jgi:hypothetical protein
MLGPAEHGRFFQKERRTMRRWMSSLALLALTLLPASGTFAAGKASGEAGMTVKGEVVDLACYVGHGAKGEMHKECAVKCAAMGQPVGILSTDGKLYVLVADHVDPSSYEKARKLAGEQVEIQGENAEKDGVNALTVHAVKKQ